MDFETANRILRYDPLSGNMVWTVNRGRIKAGSNAGCIDKHGYYKLMINKKNHYLHRLAWLLSYGYMPSDSIDHINNNKQDNRLENLRIASAKDNSRNRGLYRNSTTGLKGVSKLKNGNFMSSICVDGKSIYLGAFDTPEQAHSEYCKAAEKLHGNFARFN